MNTTELSLYVQNGALDARLVTLYGKAQLPAQRERYRKALEAFAALYKEREGVRIFSVAGRSELLGNHTDHNHGAVIATAVDLDIIAIAAPTDDTQIRLKSEGYPEDVVDISTFHAPDPAMFGKSRALVAGMCAGLAQNNHRSGGFVAYTTSNVPTGAGLSSSAAFEVMIGNIENYLYNDGKISNVEIAKIAGYTENVFFGKPCGLMDQLACAVGGIIAIDFENKTTPVIEKPEFDPTAHGYRLCIVNTRGSHANLTDDYAAVPAEMKAVAAALGKTVLREVEEDELRAKIPALREKLGDRAVLRALHFFGENRRVAAVKAALGAHDLPLFLENVKASGRSSFCYLQNVYAPKAPREQGLSLALCLAEQYLADKGGAWRVHGGGFAGTVQAFVKECDVADFCALMNGVFGEDACTVLSIRAEGATAVL